MGSLSTINLEVGAAVVQLHGWGLQQVGQEASSHPDFL